MATVYDSTKDPYLRGGELQVNKSGVAVVPSDTVDFTSYPRSVIVTVAGTVSALPLKNAEASFVNFGSLAIGTVIPFRVRRINATNTSATLVAMYD
jgi:hypothetical protein